MKSLVLIRMLQEANWRKFLSLHHISSFALNYWCHDDLVPVKLSAKEALKVSTATRIKAETLANFLSSRYNRTRSSATPHALYFHLSRETHYRVFFVDRVWKTQAEGQPCRVSVLIVKFPNNSSIKRITRRRYDKYGDACLAEDFVGTPKRKLRQAK